MTAAGAAKSKASKILLHEIRPDLILCNTLIRVRNSNSQLLASHGSVIELRPTRKDFSGEENRPEHKFSVT